MNLDELTPSEKSHVYDKIKELRDSPGWMMVQKIMRHEIETYYRKISAPTYKPDPTAHNYDRGIIEGTYRLAALPQIILDKLETDLKILASTKPPTT